MSTDHSKQFLILSSGRTGSTLLKSLLESHPMIVCFGELLNQDKILWGHRNMTAECNTPEIVARRDANPAAFVDAAYRMYAGQPLAAVGVKAIYNHLSHGPHAKEVLRHFLAMPGLKILHNKRKNLFKTHCSYLVAAERKKRGKYMCSYDPKDYESDLRITVSPRRCLEFIRRTRREERFYDGLFAEKAVTDVYYEDLARRTGLEMKRVLAFLGVPYAPMKPGTHKVRRQPVDELVENYDEVREILTSKGFGEFFEDAPEQAVATRQQRENRPATTH
ncbi:MAG: sulfotransferase [Desulfovibrionaceae bacterium]